MTVRSAPDRLLDLERILARSGARPGSASGDADRDLLANLPFERLSALTTLLREGALEQFDPVDAVAARLLLDDYVAAVRQLRTTATIAAGRVDDSARAVTAARRLVENLDRAVARETARQGKLALKRARRSVDAPSG